MTWQMSPAAHEKAFRLLFMGQLTDIDLHGLAAPLERPEWPPKTPTVEVYADTLADLRDLIEEIRFETAFAVMLVQDFEDAVTSGRATRNIPPDEFIEQGAVVRGMLAPFERTMHEPFDLFRDPYKHIPRFRVLQTWFAGQLFDSAAFRGVSAIDRLATLLWTGDRRQLEQRKDGLDIYPAFTDRYLDKLASSYATSPSWRHLLESPSFSSVKWVRDRFTHRSRSHSQLHGFFITEYTAREETVIAATVEDEEDFAISFYDDTLRSAVALTSAILGDHLG